MIDKIVEELLTVSLAHKDVKESKHRTISEFNGGVNKKYMYYLIDHTVPTVIDLNQNTQTYTFQTYLLDRYSNLDRKTVKFRTKQAEMNQIMTDIIKEFQRRYEEVGKWRISDETTVTVDVFDRKHLDNTIGSQATLVINAPYNCTDGVFDYA